MKGRTWALAGAALLLAADDGGLWQYKARVPAIPAAQSNATDLPAERASEPPPETGWNDPVNWPLTVPVAPDGNVLPPRAGLDLPAPLPRKSRTSALLKQAKGLQGGMDQLILLRGPSPPPGPVKLEPIGPGTHYINPPDGGTGGGSNYVASPGGGKSWEDGFRGSVSHGGGSYDYWDDTGHWHGDAPREDGSRDSRYRDNDGSIDRFYDMGDGWTAHHDPNGVIEMSGPDGSREIEHGDGTRERIDPDGNRTIDLDPDGSWHGTPWMGSRSVSAITGFAIRAGGVVIRVLVDGSVRIDGALVGPGSPLRYDLLEGGALDLWREGEVLQHLVLIWPDLSTLWIDMHPGYLYFSVQWRGTDPARRGMLGIDDGDAANDLTGRDGTVALVSDATQVAGFVESWRLSDKESLFSYADDERTADFTDLAFPYEAPTHGATDLAQSLCTGISHAVLREACLFDVGVAGDESFARSAKAAATRRETLAPKTVDFAPADGSCKAEGDDITAAALPDGGGITVMTRGDSSWSGPYAEGLPGYCIFDTTGATITALSNSGSDSSFARHDQGEIPAGPYYLKVVGAGETRLSVVTGP